MREAIGSTFIFKLMIFFIFFFASFLAIAINYSQAFSIKNQIINILEKSEGYTATSRQDIINLANSSGYYRSVNCSSRDDGENVIIPDVGQLNGICIKKLPDSSTTDNRYYQVTTYVSFNFPIIGNLFTFGVKGETKVITNFDPANEV